MSIETNIVITEPMDLSSEQLARLQSFGTVASYNEAPSREQWLNRVTGIPVVCSGKCGLSDTLEGESGTEGVYSLGRGTFVSHPFVNTAWIDANRLKAAGITVSYAPGSNREAVAEWAIYMALSMFREFPEAVGKTDAEPPLQRTEGLYGKSVAILGHGSVGTAIGERLASFHMNVRYLERGERLAEIVRDAHLVVNCLSSRPDNNGILDRDFFFDAVSDDARFMSVTSPKIYDIDAMLEALSQARLRQAAIDIGAGAPGDVDNSNYRKVVAHPKVLATAQIAHFADISAIRSYDMMVDNVEAFLKGEPINLVG